MTRKANIGNENLRQLLFWFRALIFIGPIHMLEQVLFGLDELQEIKNLLTAYYAWFRETDVATVALVVIVFTIVQLLLYGVFAGGRPRLFVAAFFGVQAVAEVHHVLRTVVHGSYNPGVVTSIAYMAIGVMLLIVVFRQWPDVSPAARTRLAAA